MRDEDLENRKYEEKIALEREKRIQKKRFIRTLLIDVVYFLFGNTFALILYSFFLSKLVSERLQSEQPVVGLVTGFSILTQTVLLILSSLRYHKDSEENRRFLEASRGEHFSAFVYYIETLKRFGWVWPFVYLVFQFPFFLYHALTGYYYEAETLFAHFYIPQLALMEWLTSFPGWIANVLLFCLIYFFSIWLTQRRWLKERIRA